MGRPIRTPRRSRGIILKCMLKKYCVKVRTEFEWSRIGLTADSCEHCNILSYSIKCKEFHDQLYVQYYDSTSRSRRRCTEHGPEHIPSTSRPHCLISYHPQSFFYLPSGCFLRNFLMKILYRSAVSPYCASITGHAKHYFVFIFEAIKLMTEQITMVCLLLTELTRVESQ